MSSIKDVHSSVAITDRPDIASMAASVAMTRSMVREATLSCVRNRMLSAGLGERARGKAADNALPV
jgi:hypothetical protein